LDQVPLGRQQFKPNQRSENAADEKEQSDGKKIKLRDAFMIGGKKPRSDTVVDIQIMLATLDFRHVHFCDAFLSTVCKDLM
jgi:hypothetical protein